MKGDQKTIEHLNRILANELTAINQYFLHAKMHENWGYRKLAEKVRKESIDEMRHADRLIEAIVHCESVRDYVTRELFESILESEEEHIDWLETQQSLIDDIGLQNYQQSQM